MDELLVILRRWEKLHITISTETDLGRLWRLRRRIEECLGAYRVAFRQWEFPEKKQWQRRVNRGRPRKVALMRKVK